MNQLDTIQEEIKALLTKYFRPTTRNKANPLGLSYSQKLPTTIKTQRRDNRKSIDALKTKHSRKKLTHCLKSTRILLRSTPLRLLDDICIARFPNYTYNAIRSVMYQPHGGTLSSFQFSKDRQALPKKVATDQSACWEAFLHATAAKKGWTTLVTLLHVEKTYGLLWRQGLLHKLPLWIPQLADRTF